jgi:hypothetical protein
MDPHDDLYDPGAQARANALRRLAREQLGQDPTADDPALDVRSRPPVGLLFLALSGVLAVAVTIGLLVWAAPRPSLLARAPVATPTRAGGACLPKAGAAIPNVRVSHDTFPAHSEPMLAQDPANPLHLVGGTKFFTDPAHYRFKIGWYSSFDGGCTWTDGQILPGYDDLLLTSDISFAFGAQGEVYAAVLTYGERSESGVAVSASHDGGRTFEMPVNVSFDPTGKVFSDKPWIAVDLTNGPRRGALYVVWSYDYGGDCGDGNTCIQALAFSRSTDSGKTFSAVQQVEGNAPFCTNPVPKRPTGSTRCDAVLGATPVVLPDGTLTVSFAYEDLLTTGKIPTRLVSLTSRDGGETWDAPVLIATIADVAGRFPPEKYRNTTLPAMACDPKTGQLYVSWSDKAAGDPDIMFSTSTDSGATWSDPRRVNDDPARNGALQFQPAIAVAPNGVVSVSFFDTRADPAHIRIDVFLAQSVDHGASFRPNVRVTSVSWDPAVGAPVDSGGSQFIGDYQGLAADNQYAHPFWNDTRDGAQQIYTAAVPSAQPI